jgi:hypothetical protein
MSMKSRLIILSIVALATSPIVFLLFVFRSKASRNFSVLRAEYSVETADLGIPGITKMYDARLVNRGITPVRIEVCRFVTDAGGRGDAPAFSVQKFDAKSSTWETIADASDARVCRPYPLGWSTADLKTRWLWPGQSVPMGEEATAARGFRKGESARFLLFTSFKNSSQGVPQGIPTPCFVIDEEAGEGAAGLRVRH